MEHLAELDDCINNLEQLQLTLDLEPPSPTVASPANEDLPQRHIRQTYRNVDYSQYKDMTDTSRKKFDVNLPDLSITSGAGLTNIHSNNNYIGQISPASSINSPDLKNVNVRLIKLSGAANSGAPIANGGESSYGGGNNVLQNNSRIPQNETVQMGDFSSARESEITEFPPPPPPISLDHDNYLVTSRQQQQQQQLQQVPPQKSILPDSSTRNQVLITSEPHANTISSPSRKMSNNSLKLSAKPLEEPFSTNSTLSTINDNNMNSISNISSNSTTNSSINNNNNNINSSNSSQSTLSLTEKESRQLNTVSPIMTLSTQSQIAETQKQTVVRFFCSDKTTKALMVDEQLTIEQAIITLNEKSFWNTSGKFSVVEKVPNLKMERFFEEHEFLLHCINSWPNTCSNMIFFEERIDVYGMFENSKMFLGENYPNGAMTVDHITRLKQSICDDQHEYQDYLYIKKPNENTWKRKFCILRKNGIFGMSKKKSKSQKDDTVMLFNSNYFLYTTTGGWTKEWNAPTPFGFAFKPYSVVNPKSKELLLFCAPDQVSMRRWCSNIRLCKFREQIFDNYEKMRSRSLITGTLSRGSTSLSAQQSPEMYQISRSLSLSQSGSSSPYNFTHLNRGQRTSLPINSSTLDRSYRSPMALTSANMSILPVTEEHQHQYQYPNSPGLSQNKYFP